MSVPEHAEASEAREFAIAFRRFLHWVHVEQGSADANEVVTLLREHVGVDAIDHAVVSRQWSPFEHVNLQAAIDAWSAESDREVAVHGITLPPHYGELDLQQLVGGEETPPFRLSAPTYVDLADGPDSTRACFRLALLLVSDARGRYALLVTAALEHRPNFAVEIAGLPVRASQEVFGELDALRSRLNVYRGQLVEASMTHMGLSLSFAKLPHTTRAEVVLPEAVLDRIERHAFGIAEYREALLAAGQHLKRGLLLYGPPGTGKTHTTRYLVVAMAGYTRLLLSGASLHGVGAMTNLARELAPAVVVLEDVDLVAEDRSFGPGSSSVLFDLLDAMDGAAADADLLFLLTTNRADLLEPALAARPGRVDVAVEIDVPDSEARRRLLLLYARSVPLLLEDAQIDEIVARTDTMTASFLKELVRRAVLESLRRSEPLTEVTSDDLRRALDDLLDSAQGVTRTLLGVGVDPADLARPDLDRPDFAGPGLVSEAMMGRSYRGRLRRGWTSYGPP